MTTKNVIGLGGYLRSGKDTVADRLVELHGYTKIGMSDPLIEMALVLNPRVKYTPEYDDKYGRSGPESIYASLQTVVEGLGYVEAKKVPEVRSFLQRLGTEVGRNMIDQNLWVNLASRRIAKILEEGGKVVLTGVRFHNELELVEDRWQGTTMWLDRPGLSAPLRSHASEATLSAEDFQYFMENSGSLHDLYTQTDDWISA